MIVFEWLSKAPGEVYTVLGGLKVTVASLPSDLFLDVF
jgi:hypothetical protein